jgi:hypothetical protein
VPHVEIPEGFIYDPVRRMWVCPDDVWAERHADANSFGCFNAFVEAKRAEFLETHEANGGNHEGL